MKKPGKPQTSSMFLVLIQGQEFNFLNEFRFTSFSGVKDETKVNTYVSPFLHREFSIPTHRSYSPITLGMPYNTVEHSHIFQVWNSYSNSPLTIQVEPIKGCQISGEETSLGYAIELFGCIWTGCEAYSVDRNEAKISELILNFTISGAKEKKL
jgi:hypothetical protein